MAQISCNFLLLCALFFTANAYDLIFKNISVPNELKDKFECSFEAHKGSDENECALGDLETDGKRNEQLKWDEDKLCIKVKCEANEKSKFAFRLQQCKLENLKKSNGLMKRPIHLVDSKGCLASNANGQWPKLVPPLRYDQENNSVEIRGWTFDNETDIGQFPDEVTLSCEVQICTELCEQSCLEKISLDKCSPNDFIGDKNATDHCHDENGAAVHGTISFHLMTLLMFFCSFTVLMFQ